VKELGVPERRAEDIVQAALLHDVGKIEAIYTEILSKPSALTHAERAVIESHVTKGVELLQSLSSFRREVIEAVRHHHEREDGKGYPDGLRGAEIPLGAKVISICDAVDAMLSDRPYRRALSLRAVREELETYAGVQFDSRLVAVVVNSAILEDHARDLTATTSPPPAKALEPRSLAGAQ
jgi:energy-coupling factor transport system substrate-specific component